MSRRVLPWLVGVLALVPYLQWTLVQPADVQGMLAFSRSDLDAGRWWTPLTAFIVPGSLSLVLLNLYVLALYGWRLERLWGSSRHLGVVVAATLTAWMVHLFIGGTTPFLGASAAAFAMLAATAIRWGDEPQLLIGGVVVRAQWVAILMGTLLLLTGLEQGPAFLAHLVGGWVIGVVAVRLVPAPRVRSKRGASPPEAVSPSLAPALAPTPQVPAMATQSAPVLTIDQILDKISAQGLAHLTPAERQILHEHSRRLRGR
jgi:membrane associated rhomboid family serine protease